MNSLSNKCQEAKEKYDQCFNNWFAERYLKGNEIDFLPFKQPPFQEF